MKAKTKFIATIMSLCLVVTLGVIGIFAVKTLNMSVGGNITFSADGLALEVSQGQFKTTDNSSYSNITTQNNKLQAFAIDTNTKLSDIQSKIDSWSNLELTLDSKGDAILHFSVTNKMTTQLYVYISTNLGSNTNDNMDLVVSPNGAEVSSNETTNFTITFDIIDTNINAGLQGFNVSVTFSKESVIQTQNKIDQATGLPTTDVDYYYIEMGTYNGQPVRWRYVADSNGIKYDGISKITSISGYYVLETLIDESQIFLLNSRYNTTTNKHLEQQYSNINVNDYGLSDIRAYLKSDNGFLKTAGISTDNIVYSLINGRTVTDLYSNILGDNGEAITAENANYCLALSGDKNISNQVDKLWLMSYQEANNFFDDPRENDWAGQKYWLRSPYIDYRNGDCDSYVFGVYNNHSTVYNGYYVRPAFKI